VSVSKALEVVYPTHPLVLRNGLGHARQPLVVGPVDPAELGHGIADPQAGHVSGAAGDNAVDFGKRRLESSGRRAEGSVLGRAWGLRLLG
jgi:hypothetical protein